MNDCILDSGTSFLQIPNGAYNTLIGTLLYNVTYNTTSDGLLAATCDTTQYSSLFLLINGNYYEIRPEVFVLSALDVDPNVEPGQCVLAFG